MDRQGDRPTMGARGRHQSVESALVEYRPQETARLVADPILQHNIGRYSIRAVANAAGVTPKVVKAVRGGKRIRKSTARKLEDELRVLQRRAADRLNRTTRRRRPRPRVR